MRLCETEIEVLRLHGGHKDVLNMKVKLLFQSASLSCRLLRVPV